MIHAGHTFHFAPVKPSQGVFIHEWLEQKHIKEWMHGVGLQNTLNGLEKFFQGVSDTTYWIGYDKAIPFAFLITSFEGKDAITLDVFICKLVGQLEVLPIFSIPWGHNVLLIQKIKDTNERLWYASKVIEHGWSRSMLTIWMENNLYKREGKAITNFKVALPAPQSDLAQQSLKDPYVFDFLTLHKEHLEKDLEDGLVIHIQKFLIELGQGFAFVGQQYPVNAGEKTLYIDLLFYHLKLRCYIIVELKGGEFDSRDAGQMSAYLSAVDDQLRHESEQPTIGIILCKTKSNVFAEYVLRNFNRPIGVAEFETRLVEKLPKELKSSLPTVEEIEAELSAIPPADKKPTKKKSKKV